jgi:outer membrane protein assembly factor BamD (BamD/ComL family)
MSSRSSLSVLLAGLLITVSAHAEVPNARTAVGTPLIQAEALLKAGRFAESLDKVREAETAAPDLTRYEQYVISRTRAAAAMRAGQTELAIAATEAALATGHLEGTAQVELMQSLVNAAYQAKDYARAARWAERYAAEGGTHPDVAPLRIQALYLAGDHAAAAAALKAKVQVDDAAGRTTSERELQLLFNAQRKLADAPGMAATLERLATRYPKPAYWSELIGRVDPRAVGDRLRLDLFRLARATGALADIDAHVALAQLALHAGFPGEAAGVLDDAAAAGVLVDASHQALRDKARKQAAEDDAAQKTDLAAARAAKDGNGLAMLGQAAAAQGRHDLGIPLMEQALARGGLRRADEVTLRLGEAQALAGHGPAAAQTLSRLARGNDGAAALARLWTLYATRVPAALTGSPDTRSRPASPA